MTTEQKNNQLYEQNQKRKKHEETNINASNHLICEDIEEKQVNHEERELNKEIRRNCLHKQQLLQRN